MVRYTVLIPQRDAGVAVSQQLPELCDVLEAQAAPFELICIDDGSSLAGFELLEEQLLVCPDLRLVRLERPHGIGTALTAGIAASRGDVLIAIEAGDRYPPNQIPKLLDGLAWADVVCASRPIADRPSFWRRVSNVTRWALPAPPVDDPGCLFWVARREAVAGLDLSDGMADYIAALVAARGYRVGQVRVVTRTEDQPTIELSDVATSATPMKQDVPLESNAPLLP